MLHTYFAHLMNATGSHQTDEWIFCSIRGFIAKQCVSETNQYVFILIWVFQFDIASSWKDRLDSSHSIIIMKLWTQQLWAKSVNRDNFHGKIASVTETKWIQRDLGNHGIIRHHHGNSSEQHLYSIQTKFYYYHISSYIYIYIYIYYSLASAWYGCNRRGTYISQYNGLPIINAKTNKSWSFRTEDRFILYCPAGTVLSTYNLLETESQSVAV